MKDTTAAVAAVSKLLEQSPNGQDLAAQLVKMAEDIAAIRATLEALALAATTVGEQAAAKLEELSSGSGGGIFGMLGGLFK